MLESQNQRVVIEQAITSVIGAEAVDDVVERLVSKKTGKRLPAGRKTRSRGSCVFPAESPSVKDTRDHFPIGDIAHARNALARVAQYRSAPSWYSGSLSSLRNAVRRAVKSRYPSIDGSK